MEHLYKNSIHIFHNKLLCQINWITQNVCVILSFKDEKYTFQFLNGAQLTQQIFEWYYELRIFTRCKIQIAQIN